MRRISLVLLALFVGGAPGKEPLLVGHRGLIRQAPENTLAGFAACLELRLGFELDVRRSKDGRLVCLHDADVKRTTNATGPVNNFTTGELRNLDAGSKFSQSFRDEYVPTLDEVLALTASRKRGPTLIALDIKIDDDKLAGDLADQIRRHRLHDSVVCIGLAIENADLRRRLRAGDPKLPRAMLASKPEDVDGVVASPDADWVYVRFLAEPALVQRIHAAKKRLFLAGPKVAGNEPANWRTARDAGYDAVLTDYPLECREAWKTK